MWVIWNKTWNKVVVFGLFSVTEKSSCFSLSLWIYNIKLENTTQQASFFLFFFFWVCLSHLVWRSYFHIAFIKVTSKFELTLKSRIIRVKMWLGHGMLLCLQMTQNCLISLLGVNKPTLSRIVLTEMGVPVLTLSNGKSYTYNPNMVCWWVVLWILSTQNLLLLLFYYFRFTDFFRARAISHDFTT